MVKLLKNLIKFLEILFLTRTLLHIDSKIENRKIDKDFQDYFRYIQNSINNSLINQLDLNSIFILYCYCPISLGILCYLKKNNPNLKYFILDDSLETVQDVNFPYVYNSIDFFRFNKKHKILNSNFKINIIICNRCISCVIIYM